MAAARAVKTLIFAAGSVGGLFGAAYGLLPDQLPGVRLARGLADELGRPVRLATHAISGSRTTDLEEQVDRALIDPPDLALVIIAGNDVTTRTSISTSATLLSRQVT